MTKIDAGQVAFNNETGGWSGEARLWQLSETVEYDGVRFAYIITSSVSNAYASETFAFPADKDGRCQSWGELPGSCRVPNAHGEVIEGFLDEINNA